MWPLFFTILSSLSFFLVFWVIDSSTPNTFLGDRETTRNLLTIPLIVLGIAFLYQAVTATWTTYSARRQKNSIDPMTPLTNARKFDDGDLAKAEYEFNVKQAAPTIILFLIVFIIFVTSSAVP